MKKWFQYPDRDYGSSHLAKHPLFACIQIAKKSISLCSSGFSIYLFNNSQSNTCKSMNFISFQITDK